MPMYHYECSKCGHKERDLAPMAKSEEPIECEKCGGESRRDYSSTAGAGRMNGIMGDWAEPILSEAAGIAPDQIPEATARFPHHQYTPDGRMVFKSKQHRKRCLQDIGMVDRDGFD